VAQFVGRLAVNVSGCAEGDEVCHDLLMARPWVARSPLPQPPVLTRQRVWLAFAIAVTVDVVQLALGPIGWAFADEILDVVAMILTWRILGFHPLLLPTFALEFLPIADWLPTWTGCVALVVASRRRQQGPPSEPPAPGPFIDV
jgi:hypothetical protein